MKSEAKTILINNAKKTSKLPAAISSIRLFPHNTLIYTSPEKRNPNTTCKINLFLIVNFLTQFLLPITGHINLFNIYIIYQMLSYIGYFIT